MESVTFAPNSQLEKIPAGTFAYTSLKTFTVPANVTVIEGTEKSPEEEAPSAFFEIATLESVYFEDGSKCAEIGDYTFEGSSLKTIELPTSVSTIGMYAFRYCASLESIVIPETTTNIGKGAFWQCTALAEVDLRSKTTELAEDLFYGCTSLTEITIPASVSVIASDTFQNTGIAAFNVDPRNVTYKADDGILYTADGTGIVMIPAQKVIVDFVVPNTVTSIGDRLFYGLESLETLVFEGGRTEPITIGEEAFAECINLRSVELTEMITAIGAEAFYYCSSLATITIPSDMTESVFLTNSWGDSDAFYGCSSLIEICNKSEIELKPGDDETCGGVAYYAIRIYSEGESTIKTSDDFTTLTLENGDVYLISYVGNETSLTIPEGITHIYSYAFSNSEVLEHVTFASTVKEIMEGAFYESTVTSVTLNEGLEAIGEGAFYYSALESLTLPSTIKEIMAEAFYGSSITSITLNEGLEVIGDSAFYYSDLESLTLPSTIKTIGSRAFYSTALHGSIALPESLETIGSSAFYYVDDVITFLVAAPSAPEGWADGWAAYDYYDGDHMVLWGFTGEEITYTFETNGGSAVESITSAEPITLPAAPTRDGYVFDGWYNNEALEGEALTGSYYNGTVTTIYAKWMTQEEFEAQFAGTSIEYAIEMSVGAQIQVDIDQGGEVVYYKFTTGEAGTYNLNLCTGDLVLYIYDASGRSIDYFYSQYDYSTYEYTEVDEDIDLAADTTYYIGVKYYSSWDTGTLYLTVTAP